MSIKHCLVSPFSFLLSQTILSCYYCVRNIDVAHKEEFMSLQHLLHFPKAFPQDACRYEQKYICSLAELAQLEIRLGALMQPDPHAGADGTYRVRSLYFDTYDDRLCRENEDGTSPRSKWRIRCYDLRRDHIALECKVHENDRIRKRSCLLSEREADILMHGGRIEPGPDRHPLVNRFAVLQRTELMRPASIVDYIRRPLTFPEGNVRVTFDRSISSGSASDDLLDADAPLRPVLSPGQELLEVKYDTLLPGAVRDAIQMRNMQRISFSKYYLSRRYHL